jgi:hypothetical protein
LVTQVNELDIFDSETCRWSVIDKHFQEVFEEGAQQLMGEKCELIKKWEACDADEKESSRVETEIALKEIEKSEKVKPKDRNLTMREFLELICRIAVQQCVRPSMFPQCSLKPSNPECSLNVP